jgi:hypothetical protein
MSVKVLLSTRYELFGTHRFRADCVDTRWAYCERGVQRRGDGRLSVS